MTFMRRFPQPRTKYTKAFLIDAVFQFVVAVEEHEKLKA